MAEASDYYTVAEAARLLNVSRATIWRWIDRHRLPAYRVGARKIRIRREDLETVIRPARTKGVTMEKGKHTEVIWAGYDPERVVQALRRSAGALVGVDRDTLLTDIHGGREQSSDRRPA